MRKLYTTVCLAMLAMTSFAQEQNDTTYVMLDFTQNPWGYPVSEVTKGWAPDYTDWDSPGAILKDTDFSWPIKGWSDNNSNEVIKVTLYAVDLDEYNKVSVYAQNELNDAETASMAIAPGMTKMLYTQPGTTMRFEAPDGYKFGKMVFYNYRTSNFMVGDEYEEVYPYEYDGNSFTQTLKVWTPDSPKKNQYGSDAWEGDTKNILFNCPTFSAVFVKIDIRLVPDGSANITELEKENSGNAQIFALDGCAVSKSAPLRKGIYIVDGKKRIIR
mgnify:CR=1 FL=1